MKKILAAATLVAAVLSSAATATSASAAGLDHSWRYWRHCEYVEVYRPPLTFWRLDCSGRHHRHNFGPVGYAPGPHGKAGR